MFAFFPFRFSHSLPLPAFFDSQKLWFNKLEDSASSSTYGTFVPTPHDNTEDELKDVLQHPNSYELRTPILVCYPEVQQTDLIQNASENDTLLDHLAGLLPVGDGADAPQGVSIDYPPWDKQRRYSLQNVRLFFHENWVERAAPLPEETDAKKKPAKKLQHRWFEVPFEFTIRQMLQQEAYIMPQFPVIYVLDGTSPFTRNFLED